MPLLLLALLASPVPVASRQLLLSIASGWEATSARVSRYERTSAASPWRRVGPPLEASLGRSGLAWGRGLQPEALVGPVKKEADGRTPAGVFDLRGATGYAEAAPPGTRLGYIQATVALKCVDDPASAYYNRLMDARGVHKDWSSAEDMLRSDELYRLVILVGHNDSPTLPGGGSCIFLHLRERAGAVTDGCTAFDPGALEGLLAWLDPAARPVLVALPETALRSYGAEWELPRP